MVDKVQDTVKTPLEMIAETDGSGPHQSAAPPAQTEPVLIHRKTGRTAGAVVAFGIGGGLLIMGIVSTVASSFKLGTIWPAIKWYGGVLLPLFLFGYILARCRRELWLVPEGRTLRMLTFRPWYFKGPRVEQASLDEYVGVRAIRLEADPSVDDESAAMSVVSLKPLEGREVPLREMSRVDEAEQLAARLAEVGSMKLLPTIDQSELETPEESKSSS